MKIGNIYCGVLKEKEFAEAKLQNAVILDKCGIEERKTLFYKTILEFYKDLKSDKLYDYDDIYTDPDDFVSLAKIIGIDENKRISREIAFQLYYENMHSLLKLENLYIGGIINRKNVTIDENGNLIYIHNKQLVDLNRLLLQSDSGYTDLVSYEKYSLNDFGNKNEFINPQLFTSVFKDEIKDNELEKRKVLEIYHKRF